MPSPFRTLFPSALLASLFAVPLAAATFTVNSAGDAGDAVIDGVCNDGSGNCTLRAAVMEANATAALDTIAFSAPLTIGTAGVTLTNPAIIDGTTVPGYSGTPLVRVAAIGAPVNTIEVAAAAAGSELRGSSSPAARNSNCACTGAQPCGAASSARSPACPAKPGRRRAASSWPPAPPAPPSRNARSAATMATAS
ncbi:MAG TPA: hypothetical protein VF618_08020 [Thermoanaerobaculia bacterium]